ESEVDDSDDDADDDDDEEEEEEEEEEELGTSALLGKTYVRRMPTNTLLIFFLILYCS
ncbi:MAG: hypothetical protein ACI8RD_012584, partial [Bacillariaceae sp.]